MAFLKKHFFVKNATQNSKFLQDISNKHKLTVMKTKLKIV